jgi:hypothetical protein
VVVDIAIVDYSGTTPTLAELTELGRAQAARLAAAGAEPPPGLSQQALRLIGPSVDSDHGGYSRRGGEQLRLYRQTAGGYAATAASNGDAGVIDSYSYGATIIDPSMPSPVPVDYYVNVVRLPDAAAAAAFAEHRSEGWFARPWQGVRSARRIDGGAMAPGATAFAYTYSRPDGIAVPGYYVWLQVGERVAWIDVRGPGASEAAVAPLVAAQAACLEAGWCAAPVPVPPTLGRDGGVPGRRPGCPADWARPHPLTPRSADQGHRGGRQPRCPWSFGPMSRLQGVGGQSFQRGGGNRRAATGGAGIPC